MKLTKQIFGIALTAIAAGAFVACTNELTDPSLSKGKDGVLKLVKTPEVYAWSGNQTLNSSNLSDVYTVPGTSTKAISPSTRAMDGYTYGDENISWKPVVSELLNSGKYNELLDTELPEGTTFTNEKIDTDFLYYAEEDIEVTFYPIYGQSNTSHNIYVFYYDQNDIKHVLRDTPIWSGKGYSKAETVWGSEMADGSFVPGWQAGAVAYYNADSYNGITMKIKAGCKFGFIWNGTIKIWNEDKTEGTVYNNVEYSSVYSHNIPTYYTTSEGALRDGNNLIQTHAVTFNDMGCTFFGIEDWNDFDYQDTVFMFTTELKTVDADGYVEENKVCEVEDSDCGSLGHPAHFGDCPFCEKHTKCNPACPNTFQSQKGECNHPSTSHNPDGTCNDCEEWENCGSSGTPEQEVNCPNCTHPQHGSENEEYCNDCGPDNGCNKKDPDPVENCPVEGCGHPKHDGKNCDQCEEGTTCHPSSSTGGGNTGTTKPSGSKIKHDNEVEVNFELVDSHTDKNGHSSYGDLVDLATKLSIHVRHATDVDIMIPVPSKYVIDSDDLYIFKEHYDLDDNGKPGYGGALENGITTLTYRINSQVVSLNVEIVVPAEGQTSTGKGDPFDKGYIHVWTNGINQDVIDWCMEQNGDGINFEVWTYFNLIEGELDSTRDELKSYLNRSTIEFINNNNNDPNYYINAFGYDYEDGTWGQQHKENDPINPDDCTVKPKQGEPYDIEHPKTGDHLNGSPYNDIYVKNEVTADDAHKGGTTTTDSNSTTN